MEEKAAIARSSEMPVMTIAEMRSNEFHSQRNVIIYGSSFSSSRCGYQRYS
jgi:hypothetical protein